MKSFYEDNDRYSKNADGHQLYDGVANAAIGWFTSVQIKDQGLYEAYMLAREALTAAYILVDKNKVDKSA